MKFRLVEQFNKYYESSLNEFVVDNTKLESPSHCDKLSIDTTTEGDKIAFINNGEDVDVLVNNKPLKDVHDFIPQELGLELSLLKDKSEYNLKKFVADKLNAEFTRPKGVALIHDKDVQKPYEVFIHPTLRKDGFYKLSSISIRWDMFDCGSKKFKN